MSVEEFDNLLLSPKELEHHQALLVSYARGMHCAQLLETAMKCLVLALHGEGLLKTSVADLDKDFARYDKSTLGQIAKVLKDAMQNEDVNAILDQARDRRNVLAHKFFVRPIADFRTPESSCLISSELDKLTTEFFDLTKRVVGAIQQSLEIRGKMESFLQALKSEGSAGDAR